MTNHSTEDDPNVTQPTWLAELGWADAYAVIVLIGHGGMGQVWKARDLRSQQVVALKVLDPARQGNDELLARLELEAGTLERLREAGRHPNIVPLLDFAISATNACVAMEFIPGLDLLKWCDSQQLDLRERVRLLAKVARAVGWCHEHGIVHRDLKPQNVLVHAVTHEPVLVDFGIAKTGDRLPITLTSDALGTLSYMAPEQLDRERGAITTRTDVYGLGAVLYEMLTHAHPHPGGLAQVVERHRRESRPVRPAVHNNLVEKDLDSICLKAIAHRTEERYANGNELADDLERYLAGKAVSARRLSTPAYVWRQARRRPVLAFGVALVLVLACAFSWAWHEKQRSELWSRLQQIVTAAMQGREWSPVILAQADDALVAMAAMDRQRADELRQSWHSDVVGDINAALGEGRLTDEAIAWLQPSLDWMQASGDKSAAPLEALLHERMGRWETLAELRAPFQEFAGLFPRHDVRRDGDALLPAASGGDLPAIMVKQSMASPCEVKAAFTPPAAGLRQVGLGFEFHQVRTDVRLWTCRSASKQAVAGTPGASAQSDLCLLSLERNGRFVRGIVIPDEMLSHRRFELTVRVEPDRVICDVDGRWNLRLDEEFVIATSQPQDCFRILWQRDLWLNTLLIKNRREKRAPSPLEQGDAFASQGRWAEAQRKFEEHRGDQKYGIQATWKAAHAFYQQAQMAEAIDRWQSLVERPASTWRELALYDLWKHHALHGDMKQAASYLKLLPGQKQASLSLLSHITAADKTDLVQAYESAGSGLHVIRHNIEEVELAVKANGLLDVAAEEIANHFAVARHLNGLDAGARDLFYEAVRVDSQPRTGTLPIAMANCISNWSRMDRSEADDKFRSRLVACQKAYPIDANVQAVVVMENARVLARAGQYPEALALVEGGGLADPVRIAPRNRLRALLLQGMLHRLLGSEDKAQAAWQQALAAGRDNQRNPATMSLCDLFAVRSLTRTWNHEIASDVILSLVSKTQAGPQGVELQGLFASTLLADPAVIRVLNRFAEQGRGSRSLADYVLVNEPARHTVSGCIAYLLERYFVITAFASGTAPDDSERVRSTVDYLLQSVAANLPGSPDFFSYLQAWLSPGNGDKFPVGEVLRSDPLQARLRWMLGERYLGLGDSEAARKLLSAAKDEPSLNPLWRQHIEALVQSGGLR